MKMKMNMNMNKSSNIKRENPSDGQLRRLYEAALAFKAAELWRDMHDLDLICVADPVTGELGYCSIQGWDEENFGLDVYLGDAGLYGFTCIETEGHELRLDEMIALQDCLSCSFVDRQELEKAEWEETKRLGFSFRGTKQWIKFDRVEPGYSDWSLSAQECVFMTLALEQVIFAAREYLQQQLDQTENHQLFLVRRLIDGNWQGKIEELDTQVPDWAKVVFNDELAARRMRQAGCNKNLACQIDIPLLLRFIKTSPGARPIYPRVFLLIDMATGTPLTGEIYDWTEQDLAEFAFSSLRRLQEKGSLPCRLYCANLELFFVLADFCQKTGIELVLCERLDLVDNFMNTVNEDILAE